MTSGKTRTGARKHNKVCVPNGSCDCDAPGQYLCYDCGTTFEVGPDTLLECSECESKNMEKISDDKSETTDDCF